MEKKKIIVNSIIILVVIAILTLLLIGKKELVKEDEPINKSEVKNVAKPIEKEEKKNISLINITLDFEGNGSGGGEGEGEGGMGAGGTGNFSLQEGICGNGVIDEGEDCDGTSVGYCPVGRCLLDQCQCSVHSNCLPDQPITRYEIGGDDVNALTPTIYNTTIVWYDDSRNPGSNEFDIFKYDISSETTSPVTISSGTQFFPRIDHDKIVYVNRANPADWDIYLYDGTNSPVTNGDGIRQTTPDIYDDLIVYVSGESGDQDIFMCSLNPGHDNECGVTPKGIATGPGSQFAPRIDDDWIVYSDLDGDDIIIKLYEISTESTYTVVTAESYPDSPDVYEDRIVWAEGDHVYFCEGDECKNQEKTQIPSLSSQSVSLPSIYGRTIVWTQGKHVWKYEFGQLQQLTMGAATQYYANVYGRYVTWMDDETGNWVVYSCEI